MSRSLAELDRAHLWHPFTPMREWLAEPPLVIERADGCWLYDTDGNRYLDGVSSLWVNVHGHRHPRLDAAVRAQLDRVAHSTLLGLGSPPAIRLAARLAQLAPPGLSRVFFSDSGSTAVEVALKIAFQYQQLTHGNKRTKFLALDGAYHGDTLGAVSVGGLEAFHRVFRPLLFHTIRAAPTADAIERAVAEHAGELCAVIMEPLVQGAAGIRLAPPGLLRAARAACDRAGLLLIADEVATGFGRTGTMFACEQESVAPDLLCCAKGLSGGYLPVAATLATTRVFAAFLGDEGERRAFFHGHSFTGNPLGCAAALASLDVFEEERVLARLPEKIEALGAALGRHVAPLPHVKEVRQKGLMIGVELARARREPFPPGDATGARVARAARRHGVVIRPLGDVVVLMPPLAIAPDEIEHLCAATAAAIREITEGRTPPAVSPVGAAAVAAGQGAAGDRGAPAPARPRGLFVVGTDTGVGKTTIAAALLRAATRREIPVLPYKPVETGCAGAPPADATLLRAAARADLPLDAICLAAFDAPVAPAAAAEGEGRALALAALVDGARALAARRPGAALVVESAGGLLSPLSATESNADLAAALGLPLLLVARDALGTVNATALALGEIRRRGLPLAGVILCATTAETSPDQASNARLIASLTGVAPLGRVPFVTVEDAEAGGQDRADARLDALADALARAIDLPALLAHLRA